MESKAKQLKENELIRNKKNRRKLSDIVHFDLFFTSATDHFSSQFAKQTNKTTATTKKHHPKYMSTKSSLKYGRTEQNSLINLLHGFWLESNSNVQLRVSIKLAKTNSQLVV